MSKNKEKSGWRIHRHWCSWSCIICFNHPFAGRAPNASKKENVRQREDLSLRDTKHREKMKGIKADISTRPKQKSVDMKSMSYVSPLAPSATTTRTEEKGRSKNVSKSKNAKSHQGKAPSKHVKASKIKVKWR